jgi:glucose/arabinose dehydrogenase
MHGKLFVTVGDGGNAANAQSLNTRLGKVLRYNRDGSIPRNNPFSRPRRRSAIWS